MKILELPRGVPAKDVFPRVLSALNPQAFQASFVAWLDSLRDLAAKKSEIDQPIFAVDGKTARRSHDRKKGLGALHSVSVWASDYGLSLGQVACDDKSHEITAIPELLRMIDITGAIITIDAMGTQRAIAAQIIKQEAGYLLALKGNQGKMHEAVAEYISDLAENDFEGVTVRRFETVEQKQGRHEVRCYIQLAVPDDLPNREHWNGTKTNGMVAKPRIICTPVAHGICLAPTGGVLVLNSGSSVTRFDIT